MMIEGRTRLARTATAATTTMLSCSLNLTSTKVHGDATHYLHVFIGSDSSGDLIQGEGT
jgi:hypothetical protein